MAYILAAQVRKQTQSLRSFLPSKNRPIGHRLILVDDYAHRAVFSNGYIHKTLDLKVNFSGFFIAF